MFSQTCSLSLSLLLVDDFGYSNWFNFLIFLCLFFLLGWNIFPKPSGHIWPVFDSVINVWIIDEDCVISQNKHHHRVPRPKISLDDNFHEFQSMFDRCLTGVWHCVINVWIIDEDRVISQNKRHHRIPRPKISLDDHFYEFQSMFDRCLTLCHQLRHQCMNN